MEALKDPEWIVRREAAQALGEFRPFAAKSAPSLLEALKDENVEVRRAALLALGRHGRESPEITAALQKFTEDEDQLSRTYAGLALALTGGPKKSSILVLTKALELENEVAGKAAARLLGEIGREFPDDVLPGVLETLAHEQSSTVAHSLRVLRYMREQAASALPKLEAIYDKGDTKTRMAVLNALETVDAEGDHAMPILKKALSDKRATLRREALMGILRYKKKQDLYLKELLASLKDTDGNNKLLTLGILRGMNSKSPEAVPALIAATKDENTRVRSFAVSVLAAYTPPLDEILPVLEQCLKDKEPVVRRVTSTALARLGLHQSDAVAPVLMKALDAESNPNVKRSIMTALKVLQRKGEPSNAGASDILEEREAAPPIESR